MRELYSKKVYPQDLAGYLEYWYCGAKGGMVEGIKIANENMLKSIFELKTNGLEIPLGNSDETSFCPNVLGNYTSESYLLTPSFVVLNELKSIKELELSLLPRYIVSVFSQNLEDMKKTTDVLNFPLEDRLK
mgnify:CR=1 FL=1